MPDQPLGPHHRTGRADRQNLGMRGRVVQFPCPVARLGDNLAIRRDDHSPDRHLTPLRRRVRLRQRGLHVACELTHRFPFRRAQAMPASMTEQTPKGDRIAKVLARAGIASRREAERLIEAGRIQVNGQTITSPALNVTTQDKISFDGKEIGAPDASRLWLYHKPIDLVTTARDEKGRKTVFDALPAGMPRVMSVGRLDINSEGLLLLTNDGELKRKLELPATGWLRKYRVRVNGVPADSTLQPLRDGLKLEGEKFQPMTITLDRQQGANAWLTVGLREGKNREIRRAMAAVGLSVNRLIRISYGPLQLGQLKSGAVEEVKARVLRDQLGLGAEPLKPAQKRRPARRRTR